MKRSWSNLPPLPAMLFALAVFGLSGCGSGGESADTASTRPPTSGVRAAVLRGASEDFAQGTGIGGPEFESCVMARLRTALAAPTLARLIAVYRRPHGQQFAAQALNALASPLAARCGHRSYMPEMVEASRGLRAGKARGAARALGVSYGPYLGIRCHRAGRHGCDRVGIDVVFSNRATAVTAVVGARHLRLHTPGLHNGVRHRDWVGTFESAGLGRPGSPFHLPTQPSGGRWLGSPARYVPVELKVVFVGGRRAAATFPSVFLSPGWG